MGKALPWDDLKPRVSWRGDGQYFCVSSISPQTGTQELHVIERIALERIALHIIRKLIQNIGICHMS